MKVSAKALIPAYFPFTGVRIDVPNHSPDRFDTQNDDR